METRQVLSVDAFADEPLGGVQFPVVPGDITDAQLRAVAREFGAPGGITRDGDDLRYVELDGVDAPVAGAVAACVGLQECGELDAGQHTLVRTNPAPTGTTIPNSDETGSEDSETEETGSEDEVASNDTGERTITVETTTDRTVTVESPDLSVRPLPQAVDGLAEALGVPADSIADMEDLPPGLVDGADGGTLTAPVSFLEHVSGASPPDIEAVADLLEGGTPARVVVYTFDTLVASADVHARIFDTAAAGGEIAASGLAGAACGATLSVHEAFDGQRERVRIESGHFPGRPATMTATLANNPSVTGRGLVSVDGTVGLPSQTETDIVEL